MQKQDILQTISCHYFDVGLQLTGEGPLPEASQCLAHILIFVPTCINSAYLFGSLILVGLVQWLSWMAVTQETQVRTRAVTVNKYLIIF